VYKYLGVVQVLILLANYCDYDCDRLELATRTTANLSGSE